MGRARTARAQRGSQFLMEGQVQERADEKERNADIYLMASILGAILAPTSPLCPSKDFKSEFSMKGRPGSC